MGACAGRDGEAKGKGQSSEQSQRVLLEDLLRGMRELLRLEGMALDGQVPPGSLAVQRKVRKADPMLNSAFDGRPDQAAVSQRGFKAP